jgi:4a-hydroxytetrahydrobiopterin dehydratase
MSEQGVQVAIAAHPDAVDVGFWRAVLGYVPLVDDNAIDPLGHGSTVWMQEVDPAKPLQHAMHIDVSVAHELSEERLAAALAAGGRIVDDSQAPQTWIGRPPHESPAWTPARIGSAAALRPRAMV